MSLVHQVPDHGSGMTLARSAFGCAGVLLRASGVATIQPENADHSVP